MPKSSCPSCGADDALLYKRLPMNRIQVYCIVCKKYKKVYQLDSRYYTKSGRLRHGDCYKSAALFVVENPLLDPVLVHGMHRNPDGMEIAHAWVEIGDGDVIIETTTGSFARKEHWYADSTNVAFARYTRDQTMRKLDEDGYYRAWDKQSKELANRLQVVLQKSISSGAKSRQMPERPSRDELKNRPWSYIQDHYPEFARLVRFTPTTRAPRQAPQIAPTPHIQATRTIQHMGKPEILRVIPIPSDSVPGFKYDVLLYSNGKYTCNCPAFIRGRQNSGLDLWHRPPCKHIRRATGGY